MEVFVLGHHVYKETLKPFVEEELDATMQGNNIHGKYAVAIFQERKKEVIGHLPLGKSGKFAKTDFYFLKAAKENRCQIVVYGKAEFYLLWSLFPIFPHTRETYSYA